MRIHIICAARPNFMKVAPLYHALKNETWVQPVIVHTGQHYDLNLSDAIFQDLCLPKPDIHLGVGSGTHAEQTGQVMIAYEKVLMEEQPDMVIVVGDVNSTVACTLAASKIQYRTPSIEHPATSNQQPATSNDLSTSTYELGRRPLMSYDLSPMSFELGQRPVVAHLEAGLRSFDRTMPEEINRLVTDVIADILWTPSQDAVENLISEGISSDKIHFVGNIMIDSLEMLRDKIQKQAVCNEFDLKSKSFGLVTLHRPSNVDNPDTLKNLCNILVRISDKIPLVFPVHPRTMKNLEQHNLWSILNNSPNLLLPEPLSYIRFMNMLFNCRLVITDSGGIQEETTYLGIPCLTLRPNTERPVTITQGTNQLCDVNNLMEKFHDILSTPVSRPEPIKYWDGKTANRIVEFLKVNLKANE